jgi:hypothetical protein
MAEGMRLDAAELESYISHAVDAMMIKAAALGERIAQRPAIESSNSVYALVVHSLALTTFWLDHAICGNPTERDRDGEFVASGTLANLEDQVAAFKAELPTMVRTACDVETPGSDYLQDFGWWPYTTAGVTLHVLEELYQHLGHIDITVDLLQSGG